jgi:hypothetical protein
MDPARECLRGLALATVAAFLAPYAAADDGRAGAANGLRLSFGAGAESRWVAGKADGLLSTELTLTMVPMVSVSSGITAGHGGIYYAYSEVAFHLIASLGFGLGYGAYQAEDGRQGGLAGHLFVGLPIPLTDRPADLIDQGGHFLYLLPYYRPSWGPWTGTSHELGVMLKFSYGLVGIGGWFGG